MLTEVDVAESRRAHELRRPQVAVPGVVEQQLPCHAEGNLSVPGEVQLQTESYLHRVHQTLDGGPAADIALIAELTDEPDLLIQDRERGERRPDIQQDFVAQIETELERVPDDELARTQPRRVDELNAETSVRIADALVADVQQ